MKFLERLHTLYDAGTCPLKDGYAPFCRHLFVENFVGARTGAIDITDENSKLLKSDYVKRRPEELAVLTRHVHLVYQISVSAASLQVVSKGGCGSPRGNALGCDPLLPGADHQGVSNINRRCLLRHPRRAMGDHFH